MTTRSLLAPIFVLDGLDVQVYESVHSAEWALEPWIVTEHPDIVGFDAHGQRLSLTVHRQSSQSWLGRLVNFRRECVRIAPASGPADPSALHAALVDFLRATRTARTIPLRAATSEADAAAQLPALVAAAASFARR